MTNFQKYQAYMQGFKSPQVFVDWGFYSLISSALQRRVFYGPKHSPLYCNQYITLVGPPGVGKGLVIKQISNILKELKLPIKNNAPSEGAEAIDIQVAETLAKVDYMTAENEELRGRNKESYERPLLYPMAADATTYEALVSAMARSIRRKDYREFDSDAGKEITKIYTHSSTTFCLEELSSLLRRHADDVVAFLLTGWDCGDYKKDTKTQAIDRVQRMCINFLAGTTPSFMQRTFTDGLLNEGYSSRSIFVYSARNRHNNVDIQELTKEQEQYRKDVVEHVRSLSNLYGQITWTPECSEFLQKWWDKQQEDKHSVNEKLLHYYMRKIEHVKKLAAALHFGESLTFYMNVETVMRATQILNDLEKVMHHALVYNTNNPLYRPGTKILTYLEDKMDGASLKELMAFFWESIDQKQLSNIIEHYLAVGKITTKSVNGQTKYVIVRENMNL